MEKLRIIVGGNIGLYPTGGATWDYVQYPLGLFLMGHDVYYIEDTRQFPIFQKEKKAWNDATDCVEYLAAAMKKFGMENRWAYRDVASGKTFGMDETRITEICRTADVFINVSCSTLIRDEYLSIPNRILIDSDPMFTQIQYAKELEQSSESKLWSTKTMIENHNHLFTFGENINNKNCLIPKFGFEWKTTRQPVCIDYWNNTIADGNKAFTTVLNWSGRKKLLHNNVEWGQKDVEFLKYKSVPSKLKEISFEAIINAPLNPESKLDLSDLNSNGWKILTPDLVDNPDSYRNFILNSSAEFSVAKETYVKSNSGWFSCRSACYLAASKPVVTQETGWSNYIPTGEGLFSFADEATAVESLKCIKSNYKKHSSRAREIAREFFDSEKVLTRMLNKLN